MLLLEVKINPLTLFHKITPLVFPNQILKSKTQNKITTIKDILILFTLLVSLVPKMLNLKSISIYYP